MLVHVGAVAEHFHDRRAGQQPPLRPRPARPHALVIRVEKGPKLGMEGPITWQVRRQHERFEEPRRMGQMPLHRARIRHGLDDIIFRRQRLAQGFRAAADGSIASARAAPSAVAEPACGTPGFGGEIVSLVAGLASASWIDDRFLIGNRLLFLLSRFDPGPRSTSRPLRRSGDFRIAPRRFSRTPPSPSSTPPAPDPSAPRTIHAGPVRAPPGATTPPSPAGSPTGSRHSG